jgi:hypothetical protein
VHRRRRPCGGDCPYSDRSQLAAAVAFLDEHAGQVAFITIDIGANDIFACGSDPTCSVSQVEQNLPVIVSTLRALPAPSAARVSRTHRTNQGDQP